MRTLGVEGRGADELSEDVCAVVGAELCAELGEGAEGASGEAGFEEVDGLVQEGEVVLDVWVGARGVVSEVALRRTEPGWTD